MSAANPTQKTLLITQSELDQIKRRSYRSGYQAGHQSGRTGGAGSMGTVFSDTDVMELLEPLDKAIREKDTVIAALLQRAYIPATTRTETDECRSCEPKQRDSAAA